MADYQPLIARAVEGLEHNTGENRRALYERARTALVHQLRGVQPALDESEITRERLALEEAIRKIEADAVRRALPAEPAKAEEKPTLRDQALRNFRETMAEVEGQSDTPADDGARDFVPDLPKPRHDETPRAKSASKPGFTPPVADPEPEPSPYAPHHGAPPEKSAAPDAEPVEPLPRAVRHEPLPEEPLPESWPPSPSEQYDDDDVYTRRPPRNWGRIAMIAVIVLAVIGIAGGLYWQRGAISSMFASMRSSTPAPKSQQATQPTGQPKIADRIGGDQGTSANAPAAAVAQKVVLYDEDPNDPQGKRYVGSAIWRTETVSPGPGLAPELAIRADVEIPERRMRMTWSLRRNSDKALPASHTIEIMFTLPSDFAEGGIGNVPGVLMKQNEQARGVPLAGLAVKVTNGYFLIGLSAVDIDVQRNIQLLKERDWFDIPIVYTSGKRAILAVEKGTPGGRAFEEAFRAWGQ
jgi:hypothetical protein